MSVYSRGCHDAVSCISVLEGGGACRARSILGDFLFAVFGILTFRGEGSHKETGGDFRSLGVVVHGVLAVGNGCGYWGEVVRRLYGTRPFFYFFR